MVRGNPRRLTGADYRTWLLGGGWRGRRSHHGVIFRHHVVMVMVTCVDVRPPDALAVTVTGTACMCVMARHAVVHAMGHPVHGGDRMWLFHWGVGWPWLAGSVGTRHRERLVALHALIGGRGRRSRGRIGGRGGNHRIGDDRQGQGNQGGTNHHGKLRGKEGDLPSETGAPAAATTMRSGACEPCWLKHDGKFICGGMSSAPRQSAAAGPASRQKRATGHSAVPLMRV